MNKDSLREIRNIVLIVAAFVLLIIYCGNIVSAIGDVAGVFTPFLAGIAIAFVLNLPMVAIENHVLRKWPESKAQKLKRAISLMLSIVIVCAVGVLICFAIIPQMTETFKDIGDRWPTFHAQMREYMDEMAVKYPQIQQFLHLTQDETLDYTSIVDGLSSFFSSGIAGNIVSSTVNVASSIALFFVKLIIAICFAIYLLVAKEKILHNIKTVFQVYMPENHFYKLHHFVIVLIDNFRKFIAGQCLEAIVLGIIFAIAMALFRIPYILLISITIAFTALIPVVGAFIGCAVGCFLILMVSPVKMVEFVIMFLIIQQLENKLVYPRIVGSSIGLPSIWVFVAVTVGGSLCGVVGMLVFIPLTSTAYQLLKEDVITRIGKENGTPIQGGNNKHKNRRKRNHQKKDMNQKNNENQNSGNNQKSKTNQENINNQKNKIDQKNTNNQNHKTDQKSNRKNDRNNGRNNKRKAGR